MMRDRGRKAIIWVALFLLEIYAAVTSAHSKEHWQELSRDEFEVSDNKDATNPEFFIYKPVPKTDEFSYDGANLKENFRPYASEILESFNYFKYFLNNKNIKKLYKRKIITEPPLTSDCNGDINCDSVLDSSLKNNFKNELTENYRVRRSISNRQVLFPSKRGNRVVFPSESAIPNVVTSGHRGGRADGEKKIDDIIRGIVKILAGNVKPSEDPGTRLTTFRDVSQYTTLSSRINNRGPPRIHEVPYETLPTRLPVRPPIYHPGIGPADGRPPFLANTRPPFLVPLPPSLNAGPIPNKPFITGIPLPVNVLPHGAHGDREDVTPPSAFSGDEDYHSDAHPELIQPSSTISNEGESSGSVFEIESSKVVESSEYTSASSTPSLPDNIASEISLISQSYLNTGLSDSLPSTQVSSAPSSKSVKEDELRISEVVSSQFEDPVTKISSELINHSTLLHASSVPSRLLPPSDLYSRRPFKTSSSTIPFVSHPPPPPTTAFNMPSRLPDPIRHYITTGHPGQVLEDTAYTPGRVITGPTNYQEPEIFDVTVTALQGYGKPQTKNVYPGIGPIITSALIPSEGSVYIDGKKTYFDLMPVTQSGLQTVGIGTVIPEKVEGSPFFAGVLNPSKPLAPVRTTRPPTRPTLINKPLRKKKKPSTTTLGPPKRIDTCIVGYDTTCKKELGEVCRTEGDVSSCYCKPGTARRRDRTKCKKSIVLHLSLKVDKVGDRRIVWGSNYEDPKAREYQMLSFEAEKALDSALSQSRGMSNLYLGSSVNKFYSLGGKVIVNSTVKLLHTPQTSSTNIRRNLQRHLIRVIQANNNYIGNSILVVDGPLNPVPDVSDVNECFDSNMNDCNEHASCSNTFGGFICDCESGFTDRYADDPDKSGRQCESCSREFCSKRGKCIIQNGEKACLCDDSYYGARCEIEGEVVAVAVGATVAALVIIILTLILLCMWSRRWKAQDRRGWSAFPRTPLHQKGSPYDFTMEDRIRWPQQNLYAQPELLRPPPTFYPDQRKICPPPSEYASISSQRHFGMQQLQPHFFGQQQPPYPTSSKAPSTYGQYGPSSLNTASVGGVSRAPTLGARTPLPLRDRLGAASLGPLGGASVMHNDGTAIIGNETSEEEDRPYHLPRPKSRSSMAQSRLDSNDIYFEPDDLMTSQLPPLPFSPPPPIPTSNPFENFRNY